jgi:hypothetical protein
MSESDNQITFFEILRLNEAKYPQLKWIFAVPNGGHRHVATAARLKREGVKAGVADIGVPIPSIGFHGAFVEMKHGNNRPTQEQADFLNAMRASGYAIEVAHSADEALTFIENYLQIKLNK